MQSFKYAIKSNYISSVDDIYDEVLESALRTYQIFYRLNVTGRVEPDTLTHMIKPRCGVPDIYLTDLENDVAPDFSTGDNTWPPFKRTLTYWFSTPVIILIDVLRTVLSSAFSKWSAVTKLTFQAAPMEESSDLTIGFYNLDHGYENPFDGPGDIVAHSFYPKDGRFHYDADEQWSTNPSHDQFDLESITLREIGHLLDLNHSSVKGAIMFPTFGKGIINRDLQPDDIDGIHALYPEG